MKTGFSEKINTVLFEKKKKIKTGIFEKYKKI